MSELILSAEVRKNIGKQDSKRLREKGFIPAVVYGPSISPIHISLNYREFEKTLLKIKRNSILKLQLPEQTHDVIIRDYQKDPITQRFIHIDFQAIDYNLPIRVDVDLNFVGEPIGRKAGAIFTTQLKRVKVECMPSKIPEKIDVDISNLDAGDSLHVSDIPKGDYKIISNPKLTVCQMSIIKEETATLTVSTQAQATATTQTSTPTQASSTQQTAATTSKEKETK